MLLPGFQDAHVHPPSSGYEMLHCNLSEAYSLPEYERIVREYAAAHPDDAWIVGAGWSMDVFPSGNPPKEPLDRVVADRPVRLWSRDGHSVWVNSRALEIAGVSRDTPDPVDGWIVRDEDGEPAGTLHEGAVDLVERHRARALDRGPDRRPADRADLPPLARDHGVAGRDRRRRTIRRSTPTCRSRVRGSSPRGSSERCGGTGTAASSRWRI